MTPAVQKQFFAFIDNHLHRPFIWGETDCNVLSAKAAGIVSQMDFSSWLEGQYSTKFQALRFYRRAGDMVDIMSALGASPIRAGWRRNGDLLLVTNRLFACLHVFVNGYLFSSDPKVGVVLIKPPSFSIGSFWRPPCQ